MDSRGVVGINDGVLSLCPAPVKRSRLRGGGCLLVSIIFGRKEGRGFAPRVRRDPEVGFRSSGLWRAAGIASFRVDS